MLVYLRVNEIDFSWLFWASVALRAQPSRGGIWRHLSLTVLRSLSDTGGFCSLSVARLSSCGWRLGTIEPPRLAVGLGRP